MPKAFLSFFLLTIFSLNANAEEVGKLALKYFAAKIATQQPTATISDLEAYLALLDEDIGYEHKPYRLLDETAETKKTGKQRMREGMSFYLGGNEKFTAILESVAVGHKAIAIQYSGVHAYRRGGLGPILTEEYTAMEVLELNGAKIAIIREYRE